MSFGQDPVQSHPDYNDRNATRRSTADSPPDPGSLADVRGSSRSGWTMQPMLVHVLENWPGVSQASGTDQQVCLQAACPQWASAGPACTGGRQSGWLGPTETARSLA